MMKLAIAASFPVVQSAILYWAMKRTKFGAMTRRSQQIIIGVLFGLLAVVGTEWGIPIQGATVNCRDAAVLTAGFLFGGPAGIIAGLIGGIERWFAVYWGIGYFTRVACTVSTILAGFFSAFIRKYFLEEKMPRWSFAFACGFVIEVFHVSMVFITNIPQSEKAVEVVQACTIPMVLGNSISVGVAVLVVSIISGERSRVQAKQITQSIQTRLLQSVVIAFIVTSVFVYIMQNSMAVGQANHLLKLTIEDVANDISDESDKNLLELTGLISGKINYQVSSDSSVTYQNYDLKALAKEYDVAEISVVDQDGIIINSTDERFFGFDMHSGEQSREFLCLLEGEKEYVQKYEPISYDKSIKRKYAGVAGLTGFVQVGYDAERFQRDIDEKVINLTANRHVNNSGFVLILNERKKLMSAPKDFKLHIYPQDIEKVSSFEPGKTYELNFDGEPYFCSYIDVEGYSILAMLPEAEAYQQRNVVLYVNSFIEILVFAVLFFMIFFLIKNVVVDQIKDINKSLSKITDGNLDEVVDVRSNEEFASLSDDINSTVDTLKRYIAEAAARIDQELEFAKSIQASALPNKFPAFPKHKDFDIYASMDPAKEVGGDFYDFYMTDKHMLNFLVADVSGKGIPAAMFMMRAKTELKALTEADVAINDVFTRGNEALCEGNDAGMFVTAWQGGIDLKTGLVTFANAGHNPPLVKHGEEPFEYLKSRAGFVLAGMEGIRYRKQEVQLNPGDIIFLYTDGVTEATDAHNELYGEERLRNALNSKEFQDMKELCKFVKKDVDDFVGEAPQFDDLTMVALKYIGTPPIPHITFEEAVTEDVLAVTEFAEQELMKAGHTMKTIMQINIVIDELFSNIVKYGYGKKKGKITVNVEARPDFIRLQFIDEGTPYNPLTKDDPDVTLSAEEREIGGLGIFLVKKTMDRIRYKYEEEQNKLTLDKYFSTEDAKEKV